MQKVTSRRSLSRLWKRSLKVFFGGTDRDNKTKDMDRQNRGHGSAVNKMMTTRYPASAVVMEMSVFMKLHGLKTFVEWTPREGNREADELANGVAQRFRPEYEVKLKAEELEWYIYLAEAFGDRGAGREGAPESSGAREEEARSASADSGSLVTEDVPRKMSEKCSSASRRIMTVGRDSGHYSLVRSSSPPSSSGTHYTSRTTWSTFDFQYQVESDPFEHRRKPRTG